MWRCCWPLAQTFLPLAPVGSWCLGVLAAALLAICYSLSLSLLVFRVCTNDTDNSVSFDDLAELTSALNRRSDFHVLSPFFHKIAKHAAVPPSPYPDSFLRLPCYTDRWQVRLPRRSLRFIT